MTPQPGGEILGLIFGLGMVVLLWWVAYKSIARFIHWCRTPKKGDS